MEIVLAVFCGFVLDLIFGDPQHIPHPIRFIGLLIEKTEYLFRKIFPKTKIGEIIGGVFLNITVLLITYSVAFFIIKGLGYINPSLKIASEILFCYQIFATKSLKTESMRVHKYLIKNDMINSRKYLSWIVGRDTENLESKEITKAVVETIAENTSDGVIAPMIYMLIGGAPLGFLYKAANTLDSMVGYKNDKYINFGKFSAKVDDILNFIPAVLTGILMIIGSLFIGLDTKNGWRIFKRDRNNHERPNSGKPESACAGVLNIQLGGDSFYFGKLYKKKTIGDANREIVADDIVMTNKLMYTTSILSLLVLELIRIIAVVII